MQRFMKKQNSIVKNSVKAIKTYTLELQRQGSGTSLNARLFLDDVSMYSHDDNRTHYLLEIHYHYRSKTPQGHLFYIYPTLSGHIEQKHIYFLECNSLGKLLENAADKIKDDYYKRARKQIDIGISNYIESYCFPSGHDSDYIVNEKYPELRLLHDKYKAVLVYCPYSNSIRFAVSNVCVCSFDNENDFTSINFNWKSQYTKHLESAYKRYYNDGIGCIKNASLQYNAGALVDIFNDQILKSVPNQEYKLMRSLINGINYGSFMYNMPKEGRLVADYNSNKKAGSHKRMKKISVYSPCQLDNEFTRRNWAE